MVVGTSLVQIDHTPSPQTHSKQSHIVSSGQSMQWTKYAVDAVCSGCSTQYAVNAVGTVQILVQKG